MRPPTILALCALLWGLAPLTRAQSLTLTGMEDWAPVTINSVTYPEVIYFRLQLSGYWKPTNITIDVPKGTAPTVGKWTNPVDFTITVANPGTDPGNRPRVGEGPASTPGRASCAGRRRPTAPHQLGRRRDQLLARALGALYGGGF